MVMLSGKQYRVLSWCHICGRKCDHASICFPACLRGKNSEGRGVEDRCDEAINIARLVHYVTISEACNILGH